MGTCKLDVQVSNLVKSSFVTPIEDWAECVSIEDYLQVTFYYICFIFQSWEESISPGIDALQCLTSDKSNISAAKLSISAPEKFDYNKFKKSISFVLSKISKIELEPKGNSN